MRNAAAVQRFWRNPCRTLEREDEASTSWPVGVRSVRAAYDVKLAGFATALEDRRPVFSRSRTWSTFWMGGSEGCLALHLEKPIDIITFSFSSTTTKYGTKISLPYLSRKQSSRILRDSHNPNVTTDKGKGMCMRRGLERDPFKKGSFAMKEWRYRDLRKLATTLERHSDPVNFTKDDNIFFIIFNRGRFMYDHKIVERIVLQFFYDPTDFFEVHLRRKFQLLLFDESIRIKIHEMKEVTRYSRRKVTGVEVEGVKFDERAKFLECRRCRFLSLMRLSVDETYVMAEPQSGPTLANL
ncbi:hypothetical protein V1478_008829, partial [Vespula squamosa]